MRTVTRAPSEAELDTLHALRSLTLRCCSQRLQLDDIEYRKYSLEEFGIIFKCENCTIKTGVPYNGEVSFLKPASVDMQEMKRATDRNLLK